jgi:ubiquinone biosynthesis protein
MVMLWDVLSTTRDLGRLHEIGSVLIRHGFGDVVRRLGLARALEKAGRLLHWQEAAELVRLAPAERVRRVLEELGPTFVKLGQVLATRVDMFSPEWIREFEKLQDAVPPVPFEQLREQLEEDLGAAPGDVFADLEVEALAGGSIAQVHRARLKDGTPVVLKVRRPGIRATVEADLRLFDRLASLAEKELPEVQRFRPRQMLRQLEKSLRGELDLVHEARNAERLAVALGDTSALVVPGIYWKWTCERLNVQDFVDGVPGHDVAGARRAGLDLKELAHLGSNAILKMVLEDGFFHADPHPGNVFFLQGGRIALIDFGMVGRLSEARRSEVVDLLMGLVEKDSERVAAILENWGDDAIPDAEVLAADVEGLLDEYHGRPLKEVPFGAILVEVLELLRHQGLVLPADLALLFKVLFTLESFGLRLDPEFNMAVEAEPFLRRALRRRYSPGAVARRSRRSFRRMTELISHLPDDVGATMRSVRRGRLQVKIDLLGLDRFGHRVQQAANRITLGVVIAALIVGTAIAMTAQVDSRFFGLPLLGLLSFLSSFVGGLWLLWAIWRSGRR